MRAYYKMGYHERHVTFLWVLVYQIWSGSTGRREKITLFTVNQKNKTRIGIQLTKHANLTVNRPCKYCNVVVNSHYAVSSSGLMFFTSRYNSERKSSLDWNSINIECVSREHCCTTPHAQTHSLDLSTLDCISVCWDLLVSSRKRSQSNRDRSNVQRTSNCIV